MSSNLPDEGEATVLSSPNKYSVLPLLLLPSDESTSTSTTEIIFKKISLAMSLINSFFIGELNQHKCPSSPGFHSVAPTSIQIPELTTHQIGHTDVSILWSTVATHIHTNNPELWSPFKKYVVFISHPVKKSTESSPHHHHGLGGGGLAMLPLHGIMTSLWPQESAEVIPLLSNTEEIIEMELKEAVENYGSIGRTRGWLYAASLGALAHELAHTFQLGHTKQGLMGQEFHKSIRAFFLSEEPGIPCLPSSLAYFLHFSKWVSNNSSDEDDPDPMSIPRFEGCKLICENGLGAFEIREEETAMLLKGRAFDIDTAEVTCLTLGKNDIPVECATGRAQLIAIDRKGNVLSKVISRDSLPHSLTPLRR